MLRDQLDQLYRETDKAADDVHAAAVGFIDNGYSCMPALIESVLRFRSLNQQQEFIKSIAFGVNGKTYTIITVNSSK